MTHSCSTAACVLGLTLCTAGAALAQPPIREFQPADAFIRNIVFSRDGKLIAGGTFSPNAYVWDVQTGKQLHHFKGQAGLAISAVFAPDAKTVAVTSWTDGSIRLWDLGTSQERLTLKGHRLTVHHAAYSPDGKWIASAGNTDGTVRLWDAATGKQVHAFAGHVQGIAVVAFSPDGKQIASGGLDKTVRLWDAATGKPIRSMTGHLQPVASLAFSRDGTILYSGSAEGAVREWDLAAGKRIRKWTTEKGEGRTMAVSPDGRSLAIATKQGEAQIWELASLKLRRTFPADKGYNWTLAYAPDGKTLATAGDEKIVRLWDLSAGWSTKDPKVMLADKELETLWADLAGEDAGKAYTAIWAITARPQQCVPFLARQIRGEKGPGFDAKRVGLLIKQLDHDRFAEREKASKELALAGALVKDHLENALKGDVSDEQRRRMERLLALLGEPVLLPEQLRRIRILEALEKTEGADAKRLIAEITGGNSPS